ncbi:hypothetical protein NIES3275_42320 [Microchaete diplosiphon NIES-3275]|nr:hypothetical protein NIES3275_42320 [Microchaete diplosiphon NIES-3275]
MPSYLLVTAILSYQKWQNYAESTGSDEHKNYTGNGVEKNLQKSDLNNDYGFDGRRLGCN